MDCAEIIREIEFRIEQSQFAELRKLVTTLPVSEIPDGMHAGAQAINDALKLRYMAAEICDYFGEFERARELAEEPGEYFYKLLGSEDRGEVPGSDRMLYQVRLVVQAGLCAYRKTQYSHALGMFTRCYNLASTSLSGPKKPRYETRARAIYAMGLAYREMYKLNLAIRCFTVSSELAYQSFLTSEGRSKLLLIPVARSIGFGLASVHNMMGRPDLSIPLLMASRAILPPKEEIISTHINLIHASLIPWNYLSGTDTDVVHVQSSTSDSVQRLIDCYDTFKKLHHHLYRTRAAYYLARQRIRLAEENRAAGQTAVFQNLLTEAEDNARELDATNSGDWRFGLLGLTLHSEIALQRGDFHRAENLATLGLQQATETRYPAVFLDLLLARSAARAENRQYLKAIDDLQAGLKFLETSGNLWLSSIFTLKLVQCCLRADRYLEGARYFKQHQSTAAFLVIEQTDHARLLAETSKLLNEHAESGYVLRMNADLDPEKEMKRFRKALARWARAQADSDTDTAAAEKLGVTRQTLVSWERLEGD